MNGIAALSVAAVLNVVALSGCVVPNIQKVKLGSFSSGITLTQLASANFSALPNENPITGNWALAAIQEGNETLGQIRSGVYTGIDDASYCDIVHTGASFPNDQYSSGVLAALNSVGADPSSGGAAAILCVRCAKTTDPDPPAYQFFYEMALYGPSGGIGLPTSLFVNSPVNGRIAQVTVVPQVGDVFVLAAIGNQVYVLQNGNVVVNVAGDGESNSGLPGIGADPLGGLASQVSWSFWAGGGAAAGAPVAFAQVPGSVLNLLSSAVAENKIYALSAKQIPKIVTLGATVVH
jgi:hypothetical protein